MDEFHIQTVIMTRTNTAAPTGEAQIGGPHESGPGILNVALTVNGCKPQRIVNHTDNNYTTVCVFDIHNRPCSNAGIYVEIKCHVGGVHLHCWRVGCILYDLDCVDVQWTAGLVINRHFVDRGPPRERSFSPGNGVGGKRGTA